MALVARRILYKCMGYAYKARTLNAVVLQSHYFNFIIIQFWVFIFIIGVFFKWKN